MLKLAIIGNDTLANATAECCSRHFNVSRSPVGDTDVLWFCHDTPIGADGKPDAEWVLERIRHQLVDFPVGPLVLVSSQMPVGTIATLEADFPDHSFACQPENIRVASAVADFENQARVVVGRRTTKHDNLLRTLFAPFTKTLILTDPETGELCKHALNCFLGLQIAFINEIARVCAVSGGDVAAVSQALLCERRISPKAPLRAGAPFGGGHLSRDIYVVNEIAAKHGLSIPIIASIMESNGSGM